MRRVINTIVAFNVGSLLIVAAFGVAARAQNQSPTVALATTEAVEGVVVMRDGGVLMGKIQQVGDRYVVTRGGAEMQVAASRVMLTCQSINEAYERQRERMTDPSALAHLALAEWCLRQNLLSQAGKEIEDARKLEPAHPTLSLLERRLAKANIAGREAAATSSSRARMQSTAKPVDDVALPGGVSHEIVERFTRRVQPVLVNNCTTSGCHHPGGSEEFQIDRALLRGLANRRSTMRNLAAALAVVDRDHPEQSPLLTVPRRSHGGMDHPVFGPRQEQAYKHLVDWVALVTKDKEAELDSVAAAGPSAAAATPAPRSLGFNPANPQPDVAAQATPLDFQGAARDDGASVSDKASALRAGVSPAAFDAVQRELRPKAPLKKGLLRHGTQLQGWAPRDAFDPEIFNRQTAKANHARIQNPVPPQIQSGPFRP